MLRSGLVQRQSNLMHRRHSNRPDTRFTHSSHGTNQLNVRKTAPKFSLILPSYNGQDTLPVCLAALQNLAHPGGGVEFIFVDNRSSDATAKLLEKAALRMGGQFLVEDRSGKSFALNTAIAAAQGRYLIFSDDDTLADENWLNAFAKASIDQPKMNVFAGQVRPAWQTKVPVWLKTLADRGLVCGCTPSERKNGQYPALWVKGANFMVRKELFEKHTFDTDTVNFGATSAPIGGEDSKLMQELVAAGEKIFYVKDARLKHIVQEHETTLAFILQRQVRIGRGNASIERVGIASVLWKCAEIGGYSVATPILFVAGRKASAVHQLMKLARRVGMVHFWLLRLFK